MDDRTLLEKAAKAAGITLGDAVGDYAWEHRSDINWGLLRRNANGTCTPWNPLTDDGDALRLAVKVLNWPHGGRAFDSAVAAMYAVGQLPSDPYAATRRAIVRAAASMEVDK